MAMKWLWVTVDRGHGPSNPQFRTPGLCPRQSRDILKHKRQNCREVQ